jgi:hypothetical protein
MNDRKVYSLSSLAYFALGMLVAVCSMAPKTAAFAQAVAPPMEAAAPERLASSQALVRDTLRTTRILDIYQDVRVLLSDVVTPILEREASAAAPQVGNFTPERMATAAKLLDLTKALRQAASAFDSLLAQNLDPMQDEAAALLAAQLKPEQLQDFRNLVSLPAVQKGFDAVYALSRIFTGYSFEDTQTFYDLQQWAQTVNPDAFASPFGELAERKAPPSDEKVNRANALVKDLIRISRVEDMIGAGVKFIREVYAEVAPLSDEERRETLEQVDQFAFAFGFQKTIAMAAAPALVASALTDEQLATAHDFVRSPAIAKFFGLHFDLVQAVTAYTKEDIVTAQETFAAVEQRYTASKPDESEQDRRDAQWQSFGDKWMRIFGDGMSSDWKNVGKAWNRLDSDDLPL